MMRRNKGLLVYISSDSEPDTDKPNVLNDMPLDPIINMRIVRKLLRRVITRLDKYAHTNRYYDFQLEGSEEEFAWVAYEPHFVQEDELSEILSRGVHQDVPDAESDEDFEIRVWSTGHKFVRREVDEMIMAVAKEYEERFWVKQYLKDTRDDV